MASKEATFTSPLIECWLMNERSNPQPGRPVVGIARTRKPVERARHITGSKGAYLISLNIRMQ